MIETERAVIGCILLDYEACREAIAEVQPSWFEQPLYASIMKGVRKLEAEGVTPDNTAILPYLSSSQKADMVLCAQSVDRLVHISDYVRQLKRQWRARCIAEKMTEAYRLSDGDVDELTEALRDIVKEQDAITAADDPEVGRSFIDVAADVHEGLYREKTRWLSGYRSLDELQGGLQPGTVMALAARAGSGKTDFALSLLLRYAAAGQRVLYYSMEMTGAQLLTRVAAQMARINNTRIRDNRLTDEEKQTVSRSLGALNGSGNIRIVESKAGVQVIRAHVRSWKPQVVFIDHLGLMTMPYKRERRDAVAETTRALKSLALETGIAIVELVQMNREIEKRNKKRPLLSDLKDSGTIEEDADYVLFLQAEKPEGRVLSGDEHFEVQAWLEKNRHGGTGKLEFLWRPQYSLFTTLFR